VAVVTMVAKEAVTTEAVRVEVAVMAMGTTVETKGGVALAA